MKKQTNPGPPKGMKRPPPPAAPPKVSASNSTDLLTAETSLVITQFILHMQLKGAWPCWLSIGGAPRKLTAEELIEIIDEYKAMLKVS